MADPFSTSDGVNGGAPGSVSGGERHDIQYRIGNQTEDLMGDIVMQISDIGSAPDITSVSGLSEYCISEYSAEFNSMAHKFHSRNRLLDLYNGIPQFPNANDAMTLPKVSFNGEKLSNGKTITIDSRPYGILSKASNYLRTSNSNIVRVLLYMGMDDIQSSHGNLNLVRPQKRTLESIWPSIEEQMVRNDRRFVDWLKYEFREGTQTVQKLERYSSVATDFGQMYEDVYYETKSYKTLEDEFGEDIHDRIEEQIERLTDIEL